MSQVIYPVERLLSNPRIFHAIANHLGGPDADTLRTAFYDLLENEINDGDGPEEFIFSSEEACFRINMEDDSFEIILDSGYVSVLTVVEGETRAEITNEGEFAATSAIYKRLVNAIEESHPELSGDIALCSPPTPGNGFLRSDDGDYFAGSFHLLSDPDKQYTFNVEVIDIQTDQLKATIKKV